MRKLAALLRTCAVITSVAVLAGCDDEPLQFDPFPIEIDATSGAVFAGASGPGGTVLPVTIDTMSPLTILDSYTGGDTLPTPRRLSIELLIYSAGSTVPRISLPDIEVFDIHPCNNGGPAADCAVGLDSAAVTMRGTIGTNVLASQAVRIDFSTSEMLLFPDSAGTDNDRSGLCEAIFDKPFAGGGTLIVTDGEIEYAGNRPAIGACLDAEPPVVPGEAVTERGTDVLLVVSTGLGVSILSQSAYDRYATEFGQPLSAELPNTILHLPSGPIGAKRGEIGHIALMGDVGDDSRKRGPCRELFANRALAGDLCRIGVIDPCPCPDGNFCRAGAALLLKDVVEVAVLPDENDLLQSLRVELRPEFPEVDGVLGATALASTRIELDYPNLRMMARCMDDTRCSALPQLLRRADIEQVATCSAP